MLIMTGSLAPGEAARSAMVTILTTWALDERSPPDYPAIRLIRSLAATAMGALSTDIGRWQQLDELPLPPGSAR
jgi:hypothetical protein